MAMVQAGSAEKTAAEGESAKYSSLYSGGCRVFWSLGGRRSSFCNRDWQKNDFQHSGSARNGVPVPTHLSGDSTIQRRVSYKHFHLRSVVVIPDIIIVIIVVV